MNVSDENRKRLNRVKQKEHTKNNYNNTLTQALTPPQKGTRSARRPPSPSGPRPFTRRAAGPRPPLGSPEASLPAQMCSCLCRAVSTSSWPVLGVLRFNRGGRHFYPENLLRLVENKEEKIPFAHSTGLLLFHHLIGLRLSICDGRMMWQPVFTCNFVFTSISCRTVQETTGNRKEC